MTTKPGKFIASSDLEQTLKDLDVTKRKSETPTVRYLAAELHDQVSRTLIWLKKYEEATQR